MATIYKRKDSPYYWCWWKRPDGTRARKKTGCPLAPNTATSSEVRHYEDNAQLKANKLEADDYKDYNPFQNRPSQQNLYFFDDLMMRYIEECQPGPAHINCMKHLYRFFSGYCLNDLEISEYNLINADTVTEYKAARASVKFRGRLTAPSTIRRELATFSSTINYARFEWNWKIPNYIEGRKPKSGKPRIVWATPEEAAKLLHVARQNRQAPHLVDFIELGLNTGMRKMEMLACEISRIDLRNGVIHLDPDDQKNGHYDTIPLNRTAKKAVLRRLSFIKEHCPTTPWLFPSLEKGETGKKHLGDVKTAFNATCKKAGVPHLFPHALRHTFCSWLLQAGVSIYLVKDCMRHASITQTEEYGHLVPKNRRDSVSKLDSILSRICHAELSTSKQVVNELEKIVIG
jgi:integrase